VLDPGGPQAAHIAQLSWFLIATASIVTALVFMMLGWSLFHGRRRGSDGGPIDDPATERSLGRAVAAAVAATVVILFAIIASSFWTGRSIASLRASSALTVVISGHQFWWEIQYDDAVPSQRVTTANELHIPVGRPVVLHVTSRDVIHSFWVPTLHGKRDLVPGYTTAFWIQADRPGTFQGQCAEFCGRQHAHMAFTVVAQTDGDFERWLSGRRTPAREPSTTKEQHGRDVFMAGRCSTCHAILGTQASALVGPDLTHVGSRPTIGAGTLPNTHAALTRWIANSQLDKPGNQMPANPLPPDDLDDLVTYLESLQ
jgi:cytochrome c oxidase subunit 2